MTRIALSAVAAVFLVTPAFADTTPTDDEAKKLSEAAAALGFSGGKLEKETEATGVYEIDDAKGKNGMQYDLKFDKDFNLLSVTRD